MTIEIRQMVIKSNIEDDGSKRASKESTSDDACGECSADHVGSPERLRARAALAAELVRLKER